MFELHYGGLVHKANPLGRWGLKSEVPEGCANFRTIFDGTLHFKDEDFAFLRRIEVAGDVYDEIGISVTQDKIEWTGAFSIALCEVDLADGVYRVTPYVKDKYTDILQKWEEEEEIMNGFAEKEPFGVKDFSNFEYKTFSWRIKLKRSVDYKIENGKRVFANVIKEDGTRWNENKTIPFKIKIGSSLNYYLPTLEDFLVSFPESNLSGIELKDQWLLYKIDYEIVDIINATVPIGGYKETHVMTKMTINLVRAKYLTFNDKNGNIVPPSGLLSEAEFSGFVEISPNLHLPNGSTSDKWHTYYTDEVTINGRTGNYWYLKATYFMNNYITKTFFHKGDLPLGSVNSIYFEFKNKRGFNNYSLQIESLLNAFVNKYDTTLQADIKGVWTTGNYKNLVLVNNAEITEDFITTPAYLTFKDILISLCNHFNLKWDILGNRFIVANIEYFLSYNVIDLVNSANYIYIKNKKAYKYTGALVPRQEELQCNADSLDIDFRGVAIKYKSINSSGGNEDNKQTISISSYVTDISRVLLENKTDGFCLVALEDVDSFKIINEDSKFNISVVGRYTKAPILNSSLLTGQSLVNEPLTNSKVLDLFHKTERVLPNGNMNWVDTEFENSGFIKEQVDISFQRPLLDFRLNDLFKTEVGTGRVTSFQYDSVQKITKINIKLQ